MRHTRTVFTGLLLTLASSASADVTPDWVKRLPVGNALSVGMRDMVVDAAGVTYVTGNEQLASNMDVVTTAIAPDGTLLWSHTYNGPANKSDQAGGIALGNGKVYVTGLTLSPQSQANVLLLEYEAATGALTNSTTYSSGQVSEGGMSVVTDLAGHVYVVGTTTGDGGDVLVVQFDLALNVQWTRTWDGPAFSPFSGDSPRMAAIDPNGDLLVLVYGIMSSQHPDYVVLKYGADGTILWETNWGVSGQDSPREMVIDPATGDIFVTGRGIDGVDKFSTIRLRGSDGALLWQKYDNLAFHNRVAGIALDHQGGVIVTGSVDPDGNESNANDDFYTVRRAASDGALLWTHSYGDPCLNCADGPGDVIVDEAGHVFLAGASSSPPYQRDAFLLVLDVATGMELARGAVSGGPNEFAGTGILGLDAASRLYAGGGVSNVNTGEDDMLVMGFPAYAPLVETYCEGLPNSAGSGARMASTGTTSVTSNDFTLEVSGAPPGQFGLFYYGPDTAHVPFGDGVRCVALPIYRLVPPVLVDGSGSAARLLDFTKPPAGSGAGQILAGSRWYFQFWYRDVPAGGAGFNLSDGLAAEFLP